MSGRAFSSLGARLLGALALVVVITIAGRLVLPRFGLTLPYWVPFLAFGAIVVAALLVAWENRPREGEDEGEVAGRIGPGNGRRDDIE